MSIRTAPAAVVLLAASSLTACNQAPRYRPPPGSVAEPMPQEHYPNINVHEPLTPWIMVSDPIIVRDEAGTLRVDVPIRTITRYNEDMNVQYRFEFLDELGRLLEPQPAWQYIRLEPTLQAFVSANSMDSRAADWRLEIKPAR
jgi:hypothetical protein